MQAVDLKKKRPGRPVDMEARLRIVQAASKLFLRDGFSATTMEKVARAAGMSKLTIYSRFNSKDALFAAVIHAKCQEYIPDELFQVSARTPEQSLFQIAYGLQRLVMSEEALNMEQMLAQDAKRNQALIRVFYEAGPMRGKGLIAEHLQRLHQRGELHIPDPVAASHFFSALFKGSDITMRAKMRLKPQPGDKEIRDYCRSAVKLFIRAHRPLFGTGSV